MANKNENKRVLGFIIILVLALLLFYQPGGPSQTVENIQNLISNGISPTAENTGTDPDTDFLTIRLYDKNKNLITTGSTFSIVNGVPNSYFMDLTVNLKNTGAKTLTCNLVSLSPTAFDSAVTKGAKTLPVGGKAAWTSDLIDVQPLESDTDVTFSATARCSYSSGTETTTLPDKVGTLPVSIKSEGEAGFEVSVTQGGTPDEYCGDGICQVDEDSSSCPDDCAVSTYVIFRTTDLSYVSGTAVAYSTSCGSDLVAFGKTTGACTDKNCANSDNTLTIPTSTGTTKFWYRDAENVCICELGATSGYPKRYSTSDSDASKVDISALSFDSSKEVAC